MTNNINIPDGFEFRFHPFCRNCPKYEPEATRYLANSEPCLTIITCKNQYLCEQIANYIKKKKRNNNGYGR